VPQAGSSADDGFFSLQRFTYEPNFYGPEIQAFLDAQPGPLKTARFQIGDRSHSVAEFLVSSSALFSLNPKIFLTLVEQQSQLLSTAQPKPEQTDWAMGFQGNGGQQRGLFAQFLWATREVRRATRDYALRGTTPLPQLVFADDSKQDPPPNVGLPRYAIMRLLAQSSKPEELPAKVEAFLATYTRLFGDPRPPPSDWPGPAQPFLSYPLAEPKQITSFFDHDSPFLIRNGSLTTFWGRAETDIAFAYDGHSGWDYAARPPDPVLAAADGLVVFAGNSEDGCFTPARAVILDHGNGYRTLYWHLNAVSVEAGQRVTRGTQLGIAGATGCVTGAHLHFQVQYLGRDVDPYGWCSPNPDPWAERPVGQPSRWLWADAMSPCEPAPPDAVVVDETSPNFGKTGIWEPGDTGYGGASLHAVSIQGATGDRLRPRSLAEPAIATWKPELPQAGRYRVLAYIPYALSGLVDSEEMRYLVRYSGGERMVTVNVELYRNGWADLGTYDFDPADGPSVILSTLAGDSNSSIWADAVAWLPVR
jgi:murein DD-endopeptidase MepM/ murein hydrolase activator NlpD